LRSLASAHTIYALWETTVGWIEDTIDRVYCLSAIERAHEVGTYDKPDRSKQYPLNTEKQIIDAVNLALTKARINENAIKTKAAEVAVLKKSIESRIWNRLVLAAASAEFVLIVMLLEKYT
jgi:hypothetical protein